MKMIKPTPRPTGNLRASMHGVHSVRTGPRVVEGKGDAIYAFPEARVCWCATPRDRQPRSAPIITVRLVNPVDEIDPDPYPNEPHLSGSFPHTC
jgi:hypothetical protein